MTSMTLDCKAVQCSVQCSVCNLLWVEKQATVGGKTCFGGFIVYPKYHKLAVWGLEFMCTLMSKGLWQAGKNCTKLLCI